MNRLLATLALAGLFGVLSAAPAGAAGLSPAADCQMHGKLTRSYSAAELRSSLATMPAYEREYSNCGDVLQQALLQKIGRLDSGGSSGGGSFLPIWLIVVLALLVLSGAGLGTWALRNRGSGPDGG